MPPVSAAIQTLTLVPSATPPEGIVRALEVQVERTNEGALRFQYVLDAMLGRIRVPARRASRPVDELWKHTCFEAFIAFAPQARDASAAVAAYVELNFSPSTEWAAYAFESYRNGMSTATLRHPPDICVDVSASCLRADVQVDTRDLLAAVGQHPGARLRIALATVIEDDQGHHSYWALRHAPGRPDFHHPAGFVLEV